MKHHAGGKPFYNDPHKHPAEFTSRFLSHLMDSSGDIRIAMRDDGIRVDWWEVEQEGKGKGNSKGNRSDAKGSGKRPSQDDAQSRATRPRHS